MTDYQPPPHEVAAFVHEKNTECAEQRQCLDGASSETAWAIATDTSEPDAARLEAILILLRNKDPRIPDLILSLFDESDTRVWRSAIRSIHPDDPRIRQSLRERANSEDVDAAAEALCVLAQMRDNSTPTTCEAWFTRSQGERNAAVEALRILETEEAVQLLRARWGDTLTTDEDRHTLALALVQFNHVDAIKHADDLAGRAIDAWSVAAATSLYFTRKDQGLRHMLNIFQNGTLEAKQSMVGQISSLAGHLPHAYTADGMHEALLWVDTQLANAS